MARRWFQFIPSPTIEPGSRKTRGHDENGRESFPINQGSGKACPTHSYRTTQSIAAYALGKARIDEW